MWQQQNDDDAEGGIVEYDQSFCDLPLRSVNTKLRQWLLLGVFGLTAFLALLFMILYASAKGDVLPATTTTTMMPTTTTTMPTTTTAMPTTTTATTTLPTTTTTTTTRGRQPNVIFFIADGFGPSSATFIRELLNQTSQAIPLDGTLVGTVRTYSSSSLVTDSAAGATAYSCQRKSYNGAIAVLDDQTACGTLMEAAKASGQWNTAIVTTSRITHATPAAWSAHVKVRTMEDDIALQQATQQSVDLLFGGGLSRFVRRSDRVDLLATMRGRGYTTVTNASQLAELTAEQLPVVGLFSSGHMDWEIDRRQQQPVVQPSLADMTAKALALMAAQDKPFFMMVEAARIDMAEHNHDGPAEYWELEQYMRAYQLARDFVDSRDSNTVVLAVADHETGGHTLAAQRTPPFVYPDYTWSPDVVRAVRASTEAIAAQILAGGDIRTVMSEQAAIADLTDAELAQIQLSVSATGGSATWLALTVGDVIGQRAGVGWTTPGHTGGDINLYAYGVPVPGMVSNMENTQVGRLLTDFLGLAPTVQQVTDALATLYDPLSGTTAPRSSSKERSVDDEHSFQYFSHD